MAAPASRPGPPYGPSVVGWSVPLMATKEIISWALAPDAQALLRWRLALGPELHVSADELEQVLRAAWREHLERWLR